MARHRFLRIAPPNDRPPSYREVWSTEEDRLTPEQSAALDLGCAIVTDEGRVTDLIAYYDVSEAERNTRALDLVS